MTFRKLWAATACALVLGISIFAQATSVSAQAYPSKQVKVVVGFGPGGLGDIVVRAVTQKMAASMGQAFVVENMPGPGGISAASLVAKAAPDGHTILLISGQNATSTLLFKSLPFNPSTDFDTVSTISTFDFIIVVAGASPSKSIADLVARAKADPGKFNLGTISSGSLQNLMSHLFASRAGLTVPTVPFRTTGDLIVALLAGEVQAAVETVPGVIGQVQSGQLRAVGLSSDKRRELLPNVPTVTESGVSGYQVTSWNGLVVPAKTPREVVMRINAEIAKAIAQPDIAKRFAELGLIPTPSTPEEMKKIYEDDVARWRGVITDAKLKLQ